MQNQNSGMFSKMVYQIDFHYQKFLSILLRFLLPQLTKTRILWCRVLCIGIYKIIPAIR